MRSRFRFFSQFYLALGANPLSQFMAQVFMETMLWSASLVLLISFLACLEPKLWLKTPIFDKNQNLL